MNDIRDGDVYKIIRVEDMTFEIKYGYYEEYERGRSEPVPIYPCFLSEPAYTDGGAPLVTAMQEACPGFEGEDRELGCFGCRHFSEWEDLIGICESPERKRKQDII